MARYRLIINPNTGNVSFGTISKPKIKDRSGRDIWPEASLKADIYLFQGRHIGPNKGFGVEHIWKEHKHEIQNTSFKNTAEFVASIVYHGTPLYYEIWRQDKLLRLLAYKHNTKAVLEFRYKKPYGYHWSVVTAHTFLDQRRIREGRLVGKIC